MVGLSNQNRKTDKVVFLLGGNDLEMEEIRKVLELLNVDFCDKGLRWSNACLSAYSDELEQYTAAGYDIFGVELKKDMDAPANYREIDHHNEFNARKSSLEQVFDILGLEMTRFQRLVAANDSRYIPGMLAMGATEEEVEKIRTMDRACQGVTAEDEENAELSIKEQMSLFKNVTVVKSYTPKFSCICDRLYNEKSLLVYTEEEWTYYGIYKKLLIDHFEEEVACGKIYCGGGDQGYLGMGQGVLPSYKIKLIIEEIIKLVLVREHSYHIFYFPFKWDVLDATSCDLSTRLSLTNIQAKPGSKWINSGSVNDNERERRGLYDEKNYFYDFVHPILYDTLDDNTLLKHYKREECLHNPDNCEYRIQIKQRDGSKEYVLKVDAMNLNIYSTGVGTLIFYLINDKYEDFNDILKINQYGRRVFPPFYEDIKKREQTAEFISIKGLRGDERMYFEDFGKYTAADVWKPAGFIMNLISDLQDNLKVVPIIDDRMIVNCWCQNDDISRKVVRHKDFPYSEDWYKYLYIDADSASCQNDLMRKDLIDNTTYLRWQMYGTLYGATKYSFMLVTRRSDFSETILAVGMRTIYSRMLELVIMQRATMLKFSDEITYVSVINSQNVQMLSQRIGSLYKEYIRFINKMFFRDITAQDQGMDLYKILTSQFRCEERIKDLDDEINELQAYISLLMDQERNKNAYWFSLLAAICLPATLLVGIFGMNPFDGEFVLGHFIIQSLVILLVTIITLLIFKKKLWVK